MRSLTRPDVVGAALLGAGLTLTASYPRLQSWQERTEALWFLMAMLGIAAFVLWAFVFAWYPAAAGRPVLAFPREAGLWALTVAGAGLCALTLAGFVDPVLRPLRPQDYPSTAGAWVASTAFDLGFGQLFVCFAPMALLLRLVGRRDVAMAVVTGLGLGLLFLQLRRLELELHPVFVAKLALTKLGFGLLALWLFVRGGVWLLWAWALVVQARLWPLS